MNPDIERLLAEAQAMAARGMPRDSINAHLAAGLGAEGIEALSGLAVLAKQPGFNWADAARMAAQGASFGFADELVGLGAALIPGGKGYTEARDASRDRLGQIRQTSPLPALAAEMAGGIATGGGAVKAATAGARAIGGAAGRVLGSAPAIGSALGGLFGIGEADELEDIPASAAAHAAGGAALGVAGAVASRAGRTAGAAARRVSRGRPSVELGPAMEAAEEAVRRVSREMYGPIEAAHPTVSDARVVGVLRNNELAADAARQVLGKAPGEAAEFAPSLEELQRIRSALRSKAGANRSDKFLARQYRGAASDLTQAMNDAIPDFASADAAYARASSARDAFERGYKSITSGRTATRPEQLRAHVAALNPDARNNFKIGLLARITDAARNGQPVTRRHLELIEAAGIRNQWRGSFNRASDATAIERQIERTGRAVVDAHLLQSFGTLVKRLGIAGGLGAGGYGAASLFN